MSDKLLSGAFRVWDKEEDRYLTPEQMPFMNHTGTLIMPERAPQLGHGIGAVCVAIAVDSSRYIVERFTGFYDADDRPIFEGDCLTATQSGFLLFENTAVYQDRRELWRLTDLVSCLADVMEYASIKIVGTVHDQEAGL